MKNTDHCDGLIHEEREASPISDEEIHEEREASPISEENPEVGMMFDNLDIAYRYYNDYARRVGFSVRKQRTNRNRYNSSIIDIQVLVCSCEGTYKKVLTPVKKRENKRFGCKAEFYVKYTGGRYKLIRFTAEHTHELAPPDEAHYLASHRKIQHFQAELMKKMHASGIRTSDMFSYLAEEAGGEHCLNFIRYDCYNLVQKLRNEFLRNGDVRCLQAWLREKRQENKHFFYSFLTNDAGQVRGVFFSDAKSRRDYSLFGDVLCFDTTFHTNRYNMVCAPIVGVNNHGQTVIFGCGLLDGETADAIIWLFNVFLEAMGGKRPETIFTDQSAAIANAIKHVFPDAHHRLCLWHLYQNAAKHLSNLFSKFKPFARRMKYCIYEPETVSEFEESWMEMLDDFGLRDHAWLKRLYQLREKWAQVYAHSYFCAGMTTTQRSESMNKFFKAYFKTTTILREFVDQYSKATRTRREKEKKAEHNTSQTTPNFHSEWKVEYEASKIYTRKIFYKFQDELKKTIDLDLNLQKDDGRICEYTASDLNGEGKTRTLIYDRVDQSISCSCRKFEFHGILCSHALLVYHKLKLTSLPSMYYLKRWTRAIKDEVVLDSFGEAIPNDINPLATSRYSDLSHIFQRVVSKGAKSATKYLRFKKVLLDLELEFDATPNDDEEVNEFRGTASILDEHSGEDEHLYDPKGKNPKGSKRRKRDALEKISRRKNASNPNTIGDEARQYITGNQSASHSTYVHNPTQDFATIPSGHETFEMFPGQTYTQLLQDDLPLNNDEATILLSEENFMSEPILVTNHHGFDTLAEDFSIRNPYPSGTVMPNHGGNDLGEMQTEPTFLGPPSTNYNNKKKKSGGGSGRMQGGGGRGGRKQGGGGRGGRGRKYQPKKITTPQVLDIDEPCRFPERLNVIHPNIRDFIESYEDVKDDGYSEFRAIGEQLGFNNDDGWNDVRRAILEEMRTYANEYTCFFSNEEEFKSCEISLQSEEPIAREDGWIKHPAIGVMVACAFHCVFIIVKSGPLRDESITYLPLRQPPNSLDNKIVVICNVDENKHYLKLKFMDDAPFPPIVACWRQSKYQEAARWEDFYKTKFDEWEERVYGFILARNRSARAMNFERWR